MGVDIQNQNGHTDLPNDVDELRDLFVRAGGNPNTKTFQQNEHRARQKALADYADAEKQRRANEPAWQRVARELIAGGMNFIAVLFTLILVLGGLTVGTGLLVIAEISAVEHGFTVIDPDRSGLYAAATVLFFIVVLFIREVIARNAGETIETTQVFSLRFLFRRAVYFIGWRGDWQPEYRQSRTLLQRADSAITWLMWTIVLFGLMGRLLTELNDLEMSWYEGLRHIIEQSTLKELVGYIASIPAMVGLLLATHFVVYLIHMIYVRVTGGLEVEDFLPEYSAEVFVEKELINFYRAEVLKQQVKAGLLSSGETETSESYESYES